jgi:hypothetical protein
MGGEVSAGSSVRRTVNVERGRPAHQLQLGPVTLSGDGSTDGPVGGVVDLDTRLDALHRRWTQADHPLWGRIGVGDPAVEGRALYLALGRAWSTVLYEVGVKNGFWLWVSVGDAALLGVGASEDEDEDGELALATGNGEFTWLPAASVVPVGVAREAAREFLASRERPRCLTWQEW